jgi:hypothetical protein
VLAATGTHVASTDEMTGIQALERLHPSLPMQPGHVEREEFEYHRHGTQSLIANLDVATGQIIAPSSGPTRTRSRLCRSHHPDHPDRSARRLDLYRLPNGSTHQSETLVRLVAVQCGIQEELGENSQQWSSRQHEHARSLSLRPRSSHSLRLPSPTQLPFSTKLRSGFLSSFVACFLDSLVFPCRSCVPASWPLLPTTTTRPTELFDFPYKGPSARL